MTTLLRNRPVMSFLLAVGAATTLASCGAADGLSSLDAARDPRDSNAPSSSDDAGSAIGADAAAAGVADADGSADSMMLPPEGPISVVAHGATPDDSTDDTLAIFAAARRAKCYGVPLLFPRGSYVFQIQNDPRALPGDHPQQLWSIEHDTTVSAAAFPSLREMQGLPFSCEDDAIAGAQHNFLELEVADLYQGPNVPLKRAVVGDFIRPPLSRADLSSPVDFVAYWWSRFGSDYLAQRGPCATYDAFAVPWNPKCMLASGAAHSIYGPADYTWEWAHATGPRVTTPKTVAGVTKLLRHDDVLQLDLDYPVAYDAQRHPLLGWYRDDDPIVLDWITYWLKENGVRAVSISEASWSQPLFAGKVPNFETMSYQLWFPEELLYPLQAEVSRCLQGESGGSCPATTFDLLVQRWMALFEQKYFTHPHFHAIEHAGKQYPAVFLFKPWELRKTLGSRAYLCSATDPAPKVEGVCWDYCTDSEPSCGTAETERFLEQIATEMKRRGFGGLAMFARKPLDSRLPSIARLARSDVLYVPTVYAANEQQDTLVPTDTYADLVRKVTASWGVEHYTAGNVTLSTSAVTIPPHHNRMAYEGSTPEAFGSWLEEASRRLIYYQQLGLPMPEARPIVFLYNVSEWLEAGASLQPNMHDGHGYLHAVRDAAAAAERYLKQTQFTPSLSANLVNEARPTAGSPSPWLLYCQQQAGASGSRSDSYRDEGGTTIHTVDIAITAAGTGPQHVQYYQGPFAIEEGQLYKLSFRARSVRERSIRLEVIRHTTPWSALGLDEEVILGPSWEPYALYFRAASSTTDARLDFFLGADTADVSIEQVRLSALSCATCDTL